jgi:hypothetical protein
MKGWLLMLIFAAAAGCTAGIRDDETMAGKIISGFEGEPVIPRSANRLFVMAPVNGIGADAILPRLLNRIKAAVCLDGRLGIEPDDAHADLRLEVFITKYMIQNVSFDAIGRAVRKRIWMTADVRLVNLKRNKIIFFEPAIQAFRVYSDLEQPIETESRVSEYVLDEMAKRITSKTVTGWYTGQMTEIEKGKPGDTTEIRGGGKQP